MADNGGKAVFSSPDRIIRGLPLLLFNISSVLILCLSVFFFFLLLATVYGTIAKGITSNSVAEILLLLLVSPIMINLAYHNYLHFRARENSRFELFQDHAVLYDGGRKQTTVAYEGLAIKTVDVPLRFGSVARYVIFKNNGKRYFEVDSHRLKKFIACLGTLGFSESSRKGPDFFGWREFRHE